MRDFNLRDLQLKELGILEEVDRICKKHNITYYLSYGTLLGAIRHKGFIPWDDDIDLCMKLPDYRSFKEACKAELSPKFFYQDIETDPYVHITWAKIRENNTTSLVKEMKDYPIHWGVCIDIFPLVPLANDHFSKLDTFAFKLMNLCANKKLNKYGYGRYGVLSNKTKWIPNVLCKSLYAICERFFLRERKECNYYFEYSLGLQSSYMYEKKIWDEITEVTFENGLYPAMVEFNQYLTQTYGSDYMEIPKVEYQEDHGDIIVDLSRSYKEYVNS